MYNNFLRGFMQTTNSIFIINKSFSQKLAKLEHGILYYPFLLN